jgi:replicative DNA helicase
MNPIDDPFDTTPPGVDLDTERAVLGGMITAPAVIDIVDGMLTAADFSSERHAALYDVLTTMRATGHTIDPFTLADWLSRQGNLERIGGRPEIFKLAGVAGTSLNTERYAEIVHDNAVRRRVYQAGATIRQLAREGFGEIDDLLDGAAQALGGASAGAAGSMDADLIGSDADTLFAEIDHARTHGPEQGTPTGFIDLDNMTGGFHPGQMIIIAARPAVGKSTLALDIARAVTREGRRALFFSLEMSRREVQQRWLSAEARVGLHHIRTGAITDESRAKLDTVRAQLAKVPLAIDATPGRTVAQIRAISRREAAAGGLGLVVVDYLQLIEPASAGSGRRPENRQVEVSTMSRSLKLLAKELGVPVIVVCQLNRGPEQRTDKRPTKADLRESGSLEQDADIVLLLHREDAYDPHSARAGETDLIIDKNRSGPVGTVTVASQLHYARFVDMAGGF